MMLMLMLVLVLVLVLALALVRDLVLVLVLVPVHGGAAPSMIVCHSACRRPKGREVICTMKYIRGAASGSMPSKPWLRRTVVATAQLRRTVAWWRSSIAFCSRNLDLNLYRGGSRCFGSPSPSPSPSLSRAWEHHILA